MSPYTNKAYRSNYERPCLSGRSTERFISAERSPVEPTMYPPGENERPNDSFSEFDFTATDKRTMRHSQREVPPMDLGSAVRESRIYWISPVLMLLTYLFGLAAAVGQHCFYSSLAGDYVGNIDQQQRVLRFATLFKFLPRTWHSLLLQPERRMGGIKC